MIATLALTLETEIKPKPKNNNILDHKWRD